MKYYTYLHRRNDTNAVFYIGKGHDCRAWNKKRNDHWHKIVAKHGYTVEVVAYWPTEQQALDHEIFLIWCFRQLGARLSNQTDGGQGSSGRKRPLVERQAISAKMKEITKGKNNPMFGKDPWNKGLKGHPNPGGVRKGQKRPGIGGVKAGNVPWNKGVTGYTSKKKGTKNKNPRSPYATYQSIVKVHGQIAADNFLIKRGLEHPDRLFNI